MKKRLEVFRAGKHTAVNGMTIDFGEADLLATAAAYNPALHEAPLVVGHPGLDAPAYGWVAALSVAGRVLAAAPAQVDPAFAEMVNAGRFKKISGSFYMPDAPGNPAPGVYYLRHVGFLGAAPPAVKGLKNASFAEAEEGVIEFGDWSDQVEAGLFRKLREWIIGKFGIEEADRALPGWDVDTVQTEAAQPEEPEAIAISAISPMYSEQHQPEEGSMTPEELAAREAALNQKEAAFAEREAGLKQQVLTVGHQEHLSFAEGLVLIGKMLPAHKEKAVALLDFAAGLAAGQVIEFGEGDGKTSLAVGELLKDYMANQPKIVEFGEVVKPEGRTASVDFAAAPGYAVDPAALEVHAKAVAYQAANPGVEYMAAVRAVQ